MVKVVTFGCRLNSFESEILKEKFKDVHDLCIINTCAVTAEAERQCRQAIRKIRKENPKTKIVVTGCAAQVSPIVFAQMEEVDLILGNKEKTQIEQYLNAPQTQKDIVGNIFEYDGVDPYLITGFEGRKRAYVQIQQGCNHRCSYCIVPFARGNSRSVPEKDILAQIKLLLAQGFEQICLTGVDACSYQPSFSLLVGHILKAFPELPSLQFGSLDPAALDQRFVNLLKCYPNIFPYFHLSIQSGDDGVLRTMRRRHTRQDVINLCQKIRNVRPDATFGADFICGFPTESLEAFENTCQLVEEAGIDKLHVFPYSRRCGTPAALLPQIKMEERRRRAKILRQMREGKNG